MASEDVIELGSSDEEAGPAPKKRKPMPNAMVHIPNLTIPPSKSKNTPKINPLSLAKVAISKSLTVTKIPARNANTATNKKTQNGTVTVTKIPARNANTATNKKAQNGTPLKLTQPKSFTQVVKKAMIVPVKPNNILMNPLKIAPIHQTFKSGVLGKNKQIAGPSITKLPPGITVKRAPTSNQKLFILSHNQLNKKFKGVVAKKKPRILNSSEILTVELDDEDSSSPAPASEAHQWYIRPEDQNKTDNEESKEDNSVEIKDKSEAPKDKLEVPNDTAEVQNDTPETPKKPKGKLEEPNHEPEEQKDKPVTQTNYIEITIEDSPVKPPNKRCEQVGEELTITIDDSPVKHTPKKKSQSGSDDDSSRPKKRHPHGKKKLKYPKESVKTVEIEIDPNPVRQNSETIEPEKENNNEVHIIEIEESPCKEFKPQELQASTPNKVKTPNKIKEAPFMKTTDIKTLSDDKREFHPVYQNFIDLCFQLENSNDMKIIAEKKIKAYYRQVPKEYTESEAFLDMVSSKITAIKADPEKMFLYIKDVVDELNLQRKMAQAQPVKDAAIKEQEKFLYGEDSEFDSKRQRQIRKLEKTLKKLHRAIQKLEEQEVDFDDDEDSVYLLTERYKERMVRVHAKFCQLTNTKMPSEPRVVIDPRPGQPKGPAKKLEKWINRKVPIGTPLPFPDFHDVLRCVRQANDEDKLGWNEADIMDEARDLFTRCGRKLQRRRQENEWRLAASRIATEVDPAEKSEELKKRLENNRRLASAKESEVLNKYADRQNFLKLEAVEIGDKEAEESPDESDEDEGEEKSLGNKEQRKERIKRLLHEKSKKVSQDTVQAPDDTKNKEASPSKETAAEVQETDEAASVTQKDDDGSQAEVKESSKEQDKDENNDENTIHSLSDDSNRLDSDIDELHLLQKLHSGNEAFSSSESSDSDSQIAISDSLSSGDDKKHDSDVISIENSSFSESEEKAEEKSNERYPLSDINEEISETAEAIEKEHDKTPEIKVSKGKCDIKTNEVKETSNTDEETSKEVEKEEMEVEKEEKEVEKEEKEVEKEEKEVEKQEREVEKINHKSTNDEYNESIEDILLASSDDELESEATNSKDKVAMESKESDSITMTTNGNDADSAKFVEANTCNTEQNSPSPELQNIDQEKSNIKCSSQNEGCTNLRNEVISIGETVIEVKISTTESMDGNENTCDSKIDPNSISSKHTDDAGVEEANNSVQVNSLDIADGNDNVKVTESNNTKNNTDSEVSDKTETSITEAMDVDIPNETAKSNNPDDNVSTEISDKTEENGAQPMDVGMAQGV